MPQSQELLHQIALTLIDGVGDVLSKNLVAYCGSSEQVFKEKKSHLEKIPGIGSVVASKIIESQHVIHRAEEEIEFINTNGISALFFTDEKYPQRLKYCHDSPLLVYYKGNADLNNSKIVSVVGTRTPSEYGKHMTEKLIKDLSHSGVLVVSGLAYGIDVLAHKESLSNNLDTVGVLAHGLDRLYPAAHTNYAKKMVQQGGLLTEFMSQTNPDRENFPKRNRIVAGMCDALIVVESKRQGGSLITATIANAYNKDVFAFPGRADELLSEGCNGLIKSNKANLIESAEDLFYIMNWNEEKKQPKSQIQLFTNLSDEEQFIMDCFKDKSQLHIDEICAFTQLPISKTSSHLLTLEFSNLVKSLPGKMFQLND